MEKILAFFNNVIYVQILKSIIVIIVSMIIYESITHFMKGKGENEDSKLFGSKKGKTYIKMIKSIIRYVFIIFTFLIVLQINGINVSSMLTGVGIVGIIIGFAVQDVLKDIIKGITIIGDTYYQVGDVIKFGDTCGKVLIIGLRTTKIEDMYSGNIVSISNRNIEQVEVVSNLIYLDIPFPYEVNVERAESIISGIVEDVKKLEKVEKCEYRGINKLDESSVNYQIRAYCNPLDKLQTRRDILRIIMIEFEKNDISVPYNQLDVHQK